MLGIVPYGLVISVASSKAIVLFWVADGEVSRGGEMSRMGRRNVVRRYQVTSISQRRGRRSFRDDLLERRSGVSMIFELGSHGSWMR